MHLKRTTIMISAILVLMIFSGCATGDAKRMPAADSLQEIERCVDTDGGNVPEIYGIVTFRGVKQLPDECRDDITLVENYCSDDRPKKAIMNCSSLAMVCQEGRCLDVQGNQEPDSCFDSDGNITPDTKGYVEGFEDGEQYRYDDRCENGLVVEWYCEGPSPENTDRSCDYGCSDGACQAEPCDGPDCYELVIPVDQSSFALPFEHEMYVFDFIEEIFPHGSGTGTSAEDSFRIYHYDDGDYLMATYYDEHDYYGGDNFLMRPGMSYTTASVVEITHQFRDVTPIAEPVTLLLDYDWNMVSIQGYDGYTAQTLCEDISSKGPGQCLSVSKFIDGPTGTAGWETMDGNETIVQDMALFIEVDPPINFTPGDTASCYESDGGYEISEFGWIEGTDKDGNEYKLYDECISSTEILERYCRDDQPESGTARCDVDWDYCEDGECKIAFSPPDLTIDWVEMKIVPGPNGTNLSQIKVTPHVKNIGGSSTITGFRNHFHYDDPVTDEYWDSPALGAGEEDTATYYVDCTDYDRPAWVEADVDFEINESDEENNKKSFTLVDC